MAQVLLIHHIQGLTDGVEDFADQLRAAGHEVTTPDLFDGATFATIDEGFSFAREFGFDNIGKAAEAAADEMPPGVVYAGFSLGAMSAHEFAQTRAGARGALLYHHGDVPIETFGESWPSGVDVQIHINEGDEFYESGVVTEFIDQAGQAADAELFVYPGSSHLFADSSLDTFDPDSAAQLMERTLAFLQSKG